jgi:hypothetical protein
LVDYPVANKPCVPDAAAPRSKQISFNFLNGHRQETVRVFGDPACRAGDLLFTLQFDDANGAGSDGIVRVIPTANGVSSLRQACGRYDWEAGSARDVSGDGCEALHQFFVATGIPQS